MQKVKRILQKSVLYIATLMLVSGTPMAVFATDSGEQDRRTYTYDSKSARWNDADWVYDPATKAYIPAPKPAPAPAPANSNAESPVPQTDTPDESSASTAAASPAGGNATVDTNVNGTSETSVKNDSTIGNNLNSDAKTGDAGVTYNTSAGGAKTGDANAETVVINSVHSDVGSNDTKGVAHFTADINGNVLGDITLGPAIQNATVNNNVNLSDTTNVNNATGIANNLSLNAKSGNANVSSNTSAGDATSGNANTVASVLNLINTVIAANQSFVGTINIYGNLNGDILISPEFIPQLIASNSSIVSTMTMPLTTNINDDQSIVNNVKLGATTGNATVASNTSAGSAKTGTAQTNLTILNLTGHDVSAANSLLVFVNVLGKWVGMIVDAPGATAAAIGNGVINNTTNISSTANLNNNAKITNNIDLASASGDASVMSNTLAGDATTGNATASANIANISTSTFKLTDWFGVLFINVFGTWVGSFGVDTQAGTIVPLGGTATRHKSAAIKSPNLSLGFVPRMENSQWLNSAAESAGLSDDQQAALRGMAMSAQQPLANSSSPVASVDYGRSQNPMSIVAMLSGFSIFGAYFARWGYRRWAGYHTATL